MRAVLIALAGVLALSGCSLARTPLFANGVDGGATDTGDIDPGDTGMPERDGGTPDAPLPGNDVGVECMGSEMRCRGEMHATCVGGSYEFDDCASRGAYCEVGGCVTHACSPSSVSCTGATESRCDARGTGATDTPCPRGCTDAVGCNPETACALAIAATVGLGTMRVNTCGQGDDTLFTSGCTRTSISGPDLVVRLEVPTRAAYRIELQEVSNSDPVLYVRRRCADEASTLGCDDDAAAAEGSRLDLTLDPGDYFLMLDSFRDTDEPAAGRCGDMDLVITLL